MKVLVCSLSGIGNAIYALPLVEALSTLGYEIDVKVNSERASSPMFNAHPHVARVYDETLIITDDYDEVFCCGYCFSNLNLTQCGKRTNRTIPPYMGPPEGCCDRFEKHEIDYYMDMARVVGFVGATPKLYLPTYPSSYLVLPERSVAMSVGYWKGDGHSQAKHWGNSNFVEAVKLLADKGYTSVFVGSPEDWECDARDISERVQKLNLATETQYVFECDLLTNFGVLDKCCAYVGNETCMVPAAAALGKPTLSLVMKSAPINMVCPQKNYPYPHGLALLGEREDLTPALVVDQLLDLIERGAQQKVLEICNLRV